MELLINNFLITIAALSFLAFGGFAVISIRENEKRAALISVGLALVGGGGFYFAIYLTLLIKIAILFTIGIILIIFMILFILPIGKVDPGPDTPTTRFDEREIMFARYPLQKGTPEYTSYYRLHPDHQRVDESIRAKPGLLSHNAKLFNPYHFASTKSSFFLTHALRDAVDGPVAENQQTLPKERMTGYIKDLAKYFGALDVGITELKPYHVYSHIGRGAGTYGEEIPIQHTHAIAFTVEMNHDMIGAAPYPATVMESAKQYAEFALIAVQLAAAIRSLGYPARAHIDGNYRLIVPLVARDAGVGEIGRMTILMTPKLGPRVRVGVVTTTLDLIPDQRTPNTSLIDFCNICKKCAENCPSNSIPLGGRQEIDGALRWKLNPETCFSYWSVLGTDCAICMRVCPYAHPDNLAHNLIRWGIARSGFFRRLALWMDNLFYGNKPAHRQPPKWTQVS